MHKKASSLSFALGAGVWCHGNQLYSGGQNIEPPNGGSFMTQPQVTFLFSLPFLNTYLLEISMPENGQDKYGARDRETSLTFTKNVFH